MASCGCWWSGTGRSTRGSSYFEHHVKVVLADGEAMATVWQVSERHAAHVSRNARRLLPDGRHERFVTQRCHDARQHDDASLGGRFAPRVPPEGLHWVTAEELRGVDSPHMDVLDLVSRNPRFDDGLVFDPDKATVDATWGYAYETDDGAGGGARITLPWRGPRRAQQHPARLRL